MSLSDNTIKDLWHPWVVKHEHNTHFKLSQVLKTLHLLSFTSKIYTLSHMNYVYGYGLFYLVREMIDICTHIKSALDAECSL